MQCVDCGHLRHHGECQETVTCKECGEDWIGEDGWCPTGICPDCTEFLAEREARAAVAWFDVMEVQNERAS